MSSEGVGGTSWKRDWKHPVKSSKFSSEKATPRWDGEAVFKHLKGCHKEEGLNFISGVPGLDLG